MRGGSSQWWPGTTRGECIGSAEYGGHRTPQAVTALRDALDRELPRALPVLAGRPLPASLQLIGGPGAEALLLATAAMIEAAA